jgi:hypothetical protein
LGDTAEGMTRLHNHRGRVYSICQGSKGCAMDETPMTRNDERVTTRINNPNSTDRQSRSRETSTIHNFPPPHTRHASQAPLYQTQCQKQAIVCLWVAGNQNWADIMTKSLPKHGIKEWRKTIVGDTNQLQAETLRRKWKAS